jgi:diguanylate cyclase (GGDEF)-like protein/PAS domain S-box-containing protein
MTHAKPPARGDEERNHLRTLLDSLPDMVWLKDAAGTYLTCNPAFERCLGVPQSGIIGKTDHDLAARQFADFMQAKDREAMAKGRSVVYEQSLHHAGDDREILAEIAKTPVRDGNGKVVGILGIARDITERRLLEADLQAAEQRYKTLVAGSFEGLAVVKDGRYVDANDQLLAMLGYGRDQLIGRKVEDLLHPDDRDRVLANIRIGKDSLIEHRMQRADGTSVLLEARGQSIPIGGQVVRVTALRDITEARKAEDALRLSESRLKRAELASKTGNWEFHLDRRVFITSDGAKAIFGTSRSELDHKTVRSAIVPEFHQMLDDALEGLIGRNKTYDIEYRIATLDKGERKWVRSVASFDAERNIVFGVLQDITRAKEIQSILEASEERYRGLVECQSEYIIRFDLDGRYVFANRAFCEAAGRTQEQILGTRWGSMLHPDDAAMVRETVQKILRGPGARESMEFRVLFPAGERWIAWEAAAILDPGGKVIELQAVGRDTTEQRKSQEIIWHQANFDQLTGLPNRRLLRDRLEQQVRESRRSRWPLALMFIDLDRFKEVNDALGHEQGDLLLKEVARRLRGCVRETDTVARLGGDEFTVVLGRMKSTARVSVICAQILRKLEEPYQLGPHKAHIAASIGLTYYPDDASDVQGLLRNADQAMYEAKRLGGNRFHYFEPSLQEAALRRIQTANDLRDALAADQFEVHYQPIVELATGRITKAEALVRWKHPTRGMLGPAEFIPIAEETGLISGIGEWVFRQAAQQAAHWRASRVGTIQISVNKSPVQFRETLGRESEWSDYLGSLSLGSDAIVIEITEGLLLDSSGPIRSAVSKCRDYGFEISLDDFGTGYSSLSYLKSFNINYLKIDQAFVRGLGTDANDNALCEAIIVMAHKLGLKVIAEGVESSTQRDLLAAAGCDYAQGYFYSRPVAPAEFEKLVMKRRA